MPSDVLFKVPVLMQVLVEFWSAASSQEVVRVCV